MRVGVVGCGYWGAKHVRVMHGLGPVSGVRVLDRRPGVVDDLVARFERVEVADDLPSLIDAVDAVVVATPPVSHADIALHCMARGKHVLVEKPLARTRAECALLVDEAARNDVVLMVGHTFRYHPALWRLRRAIAADEIGRVQYIDSVRLNLGPVRRDVNVIADLASHDISIANYLLDALPTKVTAWAHCHTHPTVEDEATLSLEYEQLGVTATIRVSWLYPEKIRRTAVVGDGMMAVFDEVTRENSLQIFDRGVQEQPGSSKLHSEFTYRDGLIVEPVLPRAEPLLLECEDFVGSITEGRQPMSPAVDGLSVVGLVEAACESVRTGASVRVGTVVEPQPTASVAS
jgi:predicted dehydrogenase